MTMSDTVNEKLLEEAAFFIDMFEGTMLGEVLERDVESNDLDALAAHLRDARTLAYDQEYNPEAA